MEKYRDWLPIAGLLMTLLQTVVAIVALSTRSTSQSQDVIAKRRIFSRIIGKALLFMLYSSVPLIITAGVTLDRATIVLSVNDLPWLFQSLVIVQVLAVWLILVTALVKSGLNVGIVVVYGIITSALITITTACGQKLFKSDVYFQALYFYLLQHTTVAAGVTFVAFLALSVRTIRQLFGDLISTVS